MSDGVSLLLLLLVLWFRPQAPMIAAPLRAPVSRTLLLLVVLSQAAQLADVSCTSCLRHACMHVPGGPTRVSA